MLYPAVMGGKACILERQGRPVPADPDLMTSRERSRLERALLDWLGEG